MQTANQSPKDQQPQQQSENLNEEQDSLETGGEGGATEEDGSPVLDEEDLEENELSEDQAEDVEWDGEGEEEGGSQEP